MGSDDRSRAGTTWLDQPEMARQLLAAAGYEQTKTAVLSLSRQIRSWEDGKPFPRDWTAHYASAFEMIEAELFGGVFAKDRVRAPELAERGMVRAALDLASWMEMTNAGGCTIGYLTAATKRLTFDYARRPPLEVLAEAFELQRRTVALLRSGRQRLRDAHALFENVAELFALISLLSGDVGRYPAADAFGYAAWTCAEESDSDMARALVLSAQSKTARWEQKYTEAADLARRGFELCPPSPERILLAAAEAPALQSRGDIEGAWQAMGRAQTARDEIDDSAEEATAWTCVRPRQAAYALQPALPTCTLQIAEVQLVAQQRADHMYRWERVAVAPLNASNSPGPIDRCPR
jgi:tetratricopeptide (TPR) repeat protein